MSNNNDGAPKLLKPLQHGHRNRLRNRFITSGLDAFLDHEVLELLLTYTIPRKDTKPIAWALIKKFGTLSAVLDAKAHDLQSIEGIGKNSAVFLSLVRSAMRKYQFEQIKQRKEINNPESVVRFCQASLQGESNEIFEVIYLTVRNFYLSSASTTPLTKMEKGTVYRVTDLKFSESDLTGNPEQNSVNVIVEATIMPWVANDVTTDFE